ncbi:MAG: hypothetical protein K0R39_24 [Symbiobacteriaceae bacterium]|jgi:quercetin dioxygenase-like cupin family protein|nr:hypothetical protein [Symbiobacteriaceae bacterium]
MMLQPLVMAREDAEHIWYTGALSAIRATGEDTGGAFGLVEDLLPVGFETPYHIHNNEDECFFLMDGDAEFVTQGQTIKATSGAFVFLPRRIAHGFRIVGDRPARMLVWVFPAGFEQFFIALSEPAQSLTLPPFKSHDMARVMEQSERFGLEILGPLSVGEGTAAD